jgi:DME family drug/metabolite transporter
MLTAMLWGSVGIAGKALYSLSATNPLSVGFFRMAFSAPVLLLACRWLLGRAAFRVARRDLAVMLLLGGAMAAYQVCYFSAIARLGVTVAVLIDICTAPVMVALLSALLLRERLTLAVLIALVYALLGIVFLVGGQSGGAITTTTDTPGVLLALGAGLSYAAVTLSGRALAGRYHALQPIAIGFTAGTLVLLPCTLLTTGMVVSYPPAGWLLLVYLGLIPTTLGYLLFLSGLRFTTATVASITTLLEPLTAAVLAWAIFGEQIGRYGLLGAALLLGAMLILFRSQTGEERRG